MEELASYLKQKRMGAGLSQGEVAEKLGYTTAQFVSNWERGIAKPPLVALAKLTKLYSLSVDDVLDRYLLTTKRRLETYFFKKPKGKPKK